MRRTELVTALDDGRWQCNVCQWECVLAAGERGRCLVRVGADDGIVAENDGLISAAVVGPIEDYRLWHLLPGAQMLALGGWGYAFPVDQQRGPYATVPVDPAKQRRLPPEKAASFALDQLCRGVIWNFSDPSVAHEYALEILQISRSSSRITALVTTGYETVAAIDRLGHYLDAISLDLRAFDDAAYARLAGVEQWRGILDAVAYAKNRWGCHVEVQTRLHPGVNDSADQIHGMAAWIRDTLGPQTAWHVLPGDAGAAAAQSAARAKRVGHELGLKFIYGADMQQPTNCPACGNLIVDRTGQARVVGLTEHGCSRCGERITLRTSIFKDEVARRTDQR